MVQRYHTLESYQLWDNYAFGMDTLKVGLQEILLIEHFVQYARASRISNW